MPPLEVHRHSRKLSPSTYPSVVPYTLIAVQRLKTLLQVHVLPILLTRPRKLLQVSRLITTLLSVARSASFLSAFVTSIWFAVCFTRTLVLARLFPGIPHDFWDGPFGCTFVGSLVCGASIWIERGRRRGEMALYVLPRAIRACLPAEWLKSGRASVRWAERCVSSDSETFEV